MEPTSDAQATEVTPANPEPALLSDRGPADPPEESGGGTPRSEEATARPGYTDFKLPEGVTFDPDSLRPAAELFAESGLSQEQAQKFIDLAMARESAAAQRGVQAFVDLQNRWVSEIKADPDIGGDRLKASLASAARAIDRLNVAGLREALDFTGAGNHPAIVRAFVRLGQLISEDRFRPGPPAPAAAPRSLADVIYDGGPRGSADGL
jgi:hypothetical protein